MCPMKYMDLSYEGRQLSERNQFDNGKYPHGGYRGARKHPPCGLSYDKGREFKEKVDEEVIRLMTEDDINLHGKSPTWSLLVHREPTFSDESPLIAGNFMAASKHEQTNGVNLLSRTSLLPAKPLRVSRKQSGVKYYRPNRMHQYLSATELKDSSREQVNIAYGRPTRTTLLRARNRCVPAQTNTYETRKEFFQKVDEIRGSNQVAPSTEYLQLRSVREAESLHSYLTGARYNRAHCLDSMSVEHSGVYMPRNNPALGSFFRGPKGLEYLKEFPESPRSAPASRTPPNSARRRPLTAPPPERRPLPTTSRPLWPEKKKGRRPHPHSAENIKRKQTKLNVVGSRLPIGLGKDLDMRIARMQRQDSAHQMRGAAEDEIYVVNQPPPTPNSLAPIKDEATEMKEEEEEKQEEEEKPEEVEEEKVVETVGEKEKDKTELGEEVRGEDVPKETVGAKEGDEGGEEEEEEEEEEEKEMSLPRVVVDVRGTDERGDNELENTEECKETKKGTERGEESPDTEPAAGGEGRNEEEKTEEEEETGVIVDEADHAEEELPLEGEESEQAAGETGEDNTEVKVERTKSPTAGMSEAPNEAKAAEEIGLLQGETSGEGVVGDAGETEREDGNVKTDDEEVNENVEKDETQEEEEVGAKDSVVEETPEMNNSEEEEEEEEEEEGCKSSKEVRFFITEEAAIVKGGDNEDEEEVKEQEEEAENS